MDDGTDFKQRINDVITSSGFAEERANKMDVTDLLKYDLGNSATVDLC